MTDAGAALGAVGGDTARGERLAGGGALRAIGILGVFQAGVMLVNLVRVKVVALEGGPAGLGLITVIEQIVLVAAIACTLSLHLAAVKFLSFAHSKDGFAFARAYVAFRRALVALSLFGLAATLAVTVAAPGVFGAEVEAHSRALLYALIGIPLANLLALLVRALAAARRPRAAQTVTLAQWSAIAAFASVGIVVDGLRGYFVGGVAGMALVLGAATIYLRRREHIDDHGGSLRALEEIRAHPGVLRFALVHSVIMLTAPLAYLVARYAVLADQGLPRVGLLAAAFGLSQALKMVLTPANQLFLTPALNRDEPPAAKYARTVRFRRSIMFALGAGMLPLLLFPQTMLALLFAERFTPVASFVYLFVIGEALAVLGAVNQALLIGLDDFGVNVTYVVSGQAVMTVLVLVLVPTIGIAGVGVSLIAAYALVLGLTTWRLWRRHGMPMLHGLGALAPVAVALVVIGAVAPSLPNDAALLAGKAALLAACLGVGFLAYRSVGPREPDAP